MRIGESCLSGSPIFIIVVITATLGNRKVLVRGVRNRLFAGRRDLNRISTARSHRRRYFPDVLTVILGTLRNPLVMFAGFE